MTDTGAELFQTKPCAGRYVIVDGRNALRPTFVKNLEAAPLQAPAASTATYGAAFTTQIPPLQMSEQSVRPPSAPLRRMIANMYLPFKGFMPANVAMSYTNPHVPAPGTAYDVSKDYDQSNLEYYKAHPSQYHDAEPAERTGYEGTEMYAASSRAFVDNFAAMSFRKPGDDNRVTGSADFKICVKRYAEDPIDQEMVLDFVRSCAPAAVQYILRIDILKGRFKNRPWSNKALIVFSSADACSLAREGLFDKEVNSMKLVQGPTDDDEPAEETAASEKPPPKEPRPKPEGSDQRTRKEKLRDRRREQEAQKKERRHQLKVAAAGQGPSDPGSGGVSSSGHAVPGALGSSSGSKPMNAAAAGEGAKGKGKEKAHDAHVVDGTAPLHHKQRDDEKQGKPLIVDGTSQNERKQKRDQKKQQK
ncbi:hypothetical protein BR93DRAFT_420201 [Coniochaeta sp. PMI_546]|nr:hypothetical protein BR93DRAFT_420201 [Coniochaeta sp. PMI_546]